MIAVVYSGFRYADWKLATKDELVSEFKTAGINPIFNDQKFIQQLLHKNAELINNAEKIKQIYFFGAGASSRKRKDLISAALSEFFSFGKVYVDTDLSAGAISSCGGKPGIIGILGSGSNAAYFNGKKVIPNNFGLGHILADEGSAIYLGKKLIKSYLNASLPEELERNFNRKYDLDRKQILDKIYKQPQSALFLNAFIDFFTQNRDAKFVKDLVCKGFDEYFQTYICPLKNENPDVPIHMVGFVASNFEDYLHQTAEKLNISIASVTKEPIYKVLNYCLNKI